MQKHLLDYRMFRTFLSAPSPFSIYLRPRNTMQKLKTKLKVESGQLLMTVNSGSLKTQTARRSTELKIQDFPVQKWLTGQAGSPETPDDGKEPHPSSITNKRLTVSDRKGNQVRSPVVYSVKGKCVLCTCGHSHLRQLASMLTYLTPSWVDMQYSVVQVYLWIFFECSSVSQGTDTI